MEALAGRVPALGRGEALRAALLAAVAAGLLVALGPPGGDVPAHLYRTFLVREGVHVWDNLWYGGQYPLASYSLLYYLPATVVGNVPLVFAGVLASAALFASISLAEWGESARWPARVFGVLASGPLFTGTYSYALGLAALLAAVRALQLGRTRLGIACAALTLGFSPLAFVFLCLVLGGVVLARRRVGAQTLAVGAALVLIGAVQVGAAFLFPHESVYPFRLFELLVVLAVSALGTALALHPRARARGGTVIAAVFVLWALASVTSFFVPSPIGENVTRLRSLVFPVMLLAALLTGFRPRWLASVALAFAFLYNVVPYVAVIPHRTDRRPAEASFWTPALNFLHAHSTPDYRVEVVPTVDHWEAYWVPRAGFPLARGWYRQLDIAQNPVLYRDPLTPEAYTAWLRRMGVRYVLLPNTGLGRMGERREGALLLSRRSGLVEVFANRDWRIYELPNPVPILTGPGKPRLTVFGHEYVAGHVNVPGFYRLRVRYTPYWEVRRGSVCVTRAADGMTDLEVRRAGPFVLAVRSAVGEAAGEC